MRKIILLLLTVIGMISFSSAQTGTQYKPFSTSVSFGLIPTGSGAGGTFSVEPAYSFGNNKLGFKMEYAGTDMRSIGAYGISYDRYLVNDGLLRLSLGGGLGYYDAEGRGGCSPGPTSIGNTVHTMNHFGGMVRGDIKFGHLLVGADYNFVPPTIASDIDAAGKTTGSVSHSNNYLNFRIGVVIGGGRIKKH
jgi:hypothetical protein